MIRRSAILAVMALGVGGTALPRLDNPPPWLVWNAGASVPIGLYGVDTIIDVHAGDLVVVRPPEPLARFLADRGYLPRGVPLLKHVTALAGQSVRRIGRSVTVDAIEIGGARERDSRNRALPVWKGRRVIAKSAVFLMIPWPPTRSIDATSACCRPPRSSVARLSGSIKQNRRSDRAAHVNLLLLLRATTGPDIASSQPDLALPFCGPSRLVGSQSSALAIGLLRRDCASAVAVRPIW
jgi:type IV secretory pathway protease TraF